MFNGLPQGASQIAQGATLYILNRKEPSVMEANVVNVSQPHISKSAQNNPMGAFQNLVVDLTLSIGGETTTIEFPINSAVANYPEKGWYASTDKTAVAREVESMANMSRQILTQVPMHQKIVQGCDALILQLNPEKQKEAQQTQEITMLKAQISQMNEKFDKLVGMLSGGNPANTKKEE